MPPETDALVTSHVDSRLLADVDVPHIDQYFGLWSILEEPFQAAVSRINGLDLRTHVQQQQVGQTVAKESDGRRDYTLTGDGVAIIELNGPLMKYTSSLSGGTSTVYARRQIRNAARDQDVAAIALLIDSPGGTVAGTRDLAEEVKNAGRQKPVAAYIEDLGASAAYWIASQAGRVYANPTALVGSIGTYAVIYDFSAQATLIGVKVHVLRAGQFKGAGTPGTEITADQLAHWQQIVDELNGHFVQGVAAGRKLAIDRTVELADGRVHIAADAEELRLIDGVQSFEETLTQLSEGTNRRSKTMSEETTNTVQASPPPLPAGPLELGRSEASFEELVAACPGADNDFLVSQLKSKATVEQAQAAWMEEQNARLAAKQKEVEEAQAAAKKPGVDALGSTGGASTGDSTEDPVSTFNERVAAKVRAGMNRRQAAVAVAKADRQLHREYLQATNPNKRKAQELIEDRFRE